MFLVVGFVILPILAIVTGVIVWRYEFKKTAIMLMLIGPWSYYEIFALAIESSIINLLLMSREGTQFSKKGAEAPTYVTDYLIIIDDSRAYRDNSDEFCLGICASLMSRDNAAVSLNLIFYAVIAGNHHESAITLDKILSNASLSAHVTRIFAESGQFFRERFCKNSGTMMENPANCLEVGRHGARERHLFSSKYIGVLTFDSIFQNFAGAAVLLRQKNIIDGVFTVTQHTVREWLFVDKGRFIVSKSLDVHSESKGYWTGSEYKFGQSYNSYRGEAPPNIFYVSGSGATVDDVCKILRERGSFLISGCQLSIRNLKISH